MVSTVFLTVLSGVLVFVLGQIILKLIIEPVYQFKKTNEAPPQTDEVYNLGST